MWGYLLMRGYQRDVTTNDAWIGSLAARLRRRVFIGQPANRCADFLHDRQPSCPQSQYGGVVTDAGYYRGDLKRPAGNRKWTVFSIKFPKKGTPVFPLKKNGILFELSKKK